MIAATIKHYKFNLEIKQVAQSTCGCPIPGNIQTQVGWSFEQASVVQGVPARGRRIGTR